ncbi:hypothetical protein [Actinophytocola xanthii]|uniref:Uncharacterized protein n=1 Tax=Actinophytocola xanthii TaxID=1912961 RepID=A0A1Q8CA88_9PSEU|nr:hypothetical protein [Actinophytocola xanthii]OLF11278.1 hypothetical protein BU204_30605 [Actinophytocola xanthii]
MSELGARDRANPPTCGSRRHDDAEAPVPAVPGMRLCGGCRESLEDTLIELPELYENCAYALAPRSGGLRERVSGHRPDGIVLHEAALTARADILGVLASWCALVTAERGVPGPGELAVRRLTGFLAVHLHWLTRHPAAPELADELDELSAAATEALRHSGTAIRKVVGECSIAGCELVVYAETERDNASPFGVSCENGHEWAPESWLSLWRPEAPARTEGSE